MAFAIGFIVTLYFSHKKIIMSCLILIIASNVHWIGQNLRFLHGPLKSNQTRLSQLVNLPCLLTILSGIWEKKIGQALRNCSIMTHFHRDRLPDSRKQRDAYTWPNGPRTVARPGPSPKKHDLSTVQSRDGNGCPKPDGFFSIRARSWINF